MPSAPLPKYLEIARLVESQVLSAASSRDKIPSSRQVAAAYGVSLVTASRALQVLRDKGLIRVVDRSGNYRTTPADAPEIRERWALMLRSTPGPWFQASLSFMQPGFEAVAREQSIRFETDRFDLDASRPADDTRAIRQAKDDGITGVFLLPSRISVEAARRDEVFLGACREAGLAVVLIERNLRGLARPLEYDLVAADDVDGGLRCTQHLLERGRCKIAFVSGSPTSSHEGRLAGYLTARQRAETGWGPLVLEQPADLSSKEAYGELADRLLDRGADGVVCYQDYTALGLILELLTRGTRVPRDVAITGFDNLPIGKAFAIGVTTYAFSSEALARHAVRVMRARIEDPTAAPSKVLIPGTLIVRESSSS